MQKKKIMAYCGIDCGACEVRRCAREKNIASCAVCPEYSCARLDAFCEIMPEARKLLEGLRKG